MSTPLLERYAALTDAELDQIPYEELVAQTAALTAAWEDRQRTNSILFYEPTNPQLSHFHACTKREILLSGGNRSGKSDSTLAELVIQATGMVPYSLRDRYPQAKLQRRPIRARVVAVSFETIESVIKPKLQYWRWNGPGAPGSSRGHWGWIPRDCLQGQDWNKAWSEKHRTLTLADGGVIQFNSYDQEVEKLAGSSFHVTMFDELPPKSHYVECKMRLLDTGGQLMTAMTPPTEASGISASWVYDELYEPGMADHPDIAAFELFTEQNRILGAEELRWIAAGLTEEERQVRLYGRFLHLSGLIHPLFTVKERQWCWTCDRPIAAMVGGACPACGGQDVCLYSHAVEPLDWPSEWPSVFVIDPHPRKPAACAWEVLTPDDRRIRVAELEASGTAEEVWEQIQRVESEQGLRPALRLMDPNAAECANDKAERGWTMRREFDKVGLRCSLAVDAFSPGVSRVNEDLRPDPYTLRPRWQAFTSCRQTLHQMGRYTWDEWARGEETKSPKPKPRDKFKDMPDTVRYVAMANPSYAGLQRGYEPIRRGRRAA